MKRTWRTAKDGCLYFIAGKRKLPALGDPIVVPVVTLRSEAVMFSAWKNNEERIGTPFATADEAKAAVERALT